ncbi:MAG TPA: hypothetical protein VG537_05255 [Candidatus Kapabacteria bacterium]|jgi:hypothetical protein|nr:hypothetical protein [Candidatus Kapabacteria bacterium]
MKSERVKQEGTTRAEPVRLRGTIGSDWLRKQGAPEVIADAVLRDWRDELERKLIEELGVDADLSIAKETRFAFITTSEQHTIVEIESFARKALDSFLDRRTRA